MRCDAVLPGWLKPFPVYLREAGYYCTNNSKTDYQFSKPQPSEIWDESSAKAHWKKPSRRQTLLRRLQLHGCHESGIAGKDKYEEVTKGLAPDQRQDPAKLTTLPPYYPDTPAVREDWKRNYELITAMDAWAGGLIAELKEAGEWDNTVVMFWSDHGTGLPRRKRWLYDSGTHIPLIARLPEKFRSGFAVKAPGESDGPARQFRRLRPDPAHARRTDGAETPSGPPLPFRRNRAPMSSAHATAWTSATTSSARCGDGRWRYVRNFEPLKPCTQFINTCENGTTMREIRAATAREDDARGGVPLHRAAEAGGGALRPRERPARGPQPRRRSRPRGEAGRIARRPHRWQLEIGISASSRNPRSSAARRRPAPPSPSSTATATGTSS